jgi:hypothetical protein
MDCIQFLKWKYIETISQYCKLINRFGYETNATNPLKQEIENQGTHMTNPLHIKLKRTDNTNSSKNWE